MEPAKYQAILDLVHREVIPAVGCTEPVAVALCCAKAARLLGSMPDQIEVGLSANVLKNAMGVGIPGTGMTGLSIAIALGALAGDPDCGLEVLKNITQPDVERGREFMERGAIKISLREDVPILYIDVTCRNAASHSRAVIAGTHTNFIYLSAGDQIMQDKLGQQGDDSPEDDGAPRLDLRTVYDFSIEAPLADIEFIMEAGRMNMAAAELSLQGNYGHGLGKMVQNRGAQTLGKGTYADILAYTSAACDARMDGAMIPVMSNSGSGNQGIASSIPVMVFARNNGSSHEDLVRALMLSSLTVIYIKQGLGRLSALCGCVVASTGSCCGITYLMGARSYEHMCCAVKNMIANLTGMICDGAKPSCALKVSSGTSTAFLSALMASEGRCVSCVEGIIDDDVERCVENLTRIAAAGMSQTDRLVLDIMTGKR